MAVTDLWFRKDKTPTARNGKGLRYRVTVTGHRARSFRTKGAAEAYELTLKTSGPPKPRPDTTVGDLLDAYKATKAGLSKSARSVVAGAIGHVRERWADTRVDDVYSHEVQAWISALSYTRAGQQVAASRDLKSKALAALRGTLDIARARGEIDTNPCAGVSLGRAQRRDARFLTVDQLGSLAAAADRFEAMVWTLGTTGVRVGECCAANVGDVTTKTVSGRKVHRLRVRKSKNGTPRDVPIPASTFARLDLARAAAEPLFLSVQGKRVNVRNFRRRVFEPAAATVDPELHVHDLRHTAASLMIRSGATVKDVQRALGHKSAAMTLDLYSHWWDDALDGVSERMESLLAAATQPASGPDL